MDKQKQLEARIKLTEEVMVWQKDKNHVVLELATGVGKSGISFNIISSVPHERILVSVPQEPLKDNYTKDAKDLGFGHLVDNMELICHASLSKHVGKEFDVLIIDESQGTVSDKRIEALSKIKANKVILLSATLEMAAKKSLSKVFDLNVFECGYEEAVERGILPEAKVHIIRVKLDKVVKNCAIKSKKLLLTQEEYYEQLCRKINYWKERYEDGEAWAKNKMLQVGGERIAWLGEVKKRKLIQVLDRVGERRAIVFCSSKEQAHELGHGTAVSSDNSKVENKATINSYNKGEIDKLFCKNMLTEGMNLYDTPFGVVVGLGSKELRGTQILGRILRHDSPQLVIIAVEGTVDERFLEQSFGYNIRGEKIDKYL